MRETRSLTRQCWTLLLATAALFVAGVASSAEGDTKQIGFFSSSLPWAHDQLHLLSQSLSDAGQGIHWITVDKSGALPVGTYSGESMATAFPSVPPNFGTLKLTVVGGDTDLKSSALEKIAKSNSIEAVVTDIENIVSDSAYSIPVIGWVPFEAEDPESWSKKYNGLLVQSSKAENFARGENPDANVGYSPFICDRLQVAGKFVKSQQYLKTMSPDEADTVLRSLTEEERLEGAVYEGNVPPTLFGFDRDTFIVLLHGDEYKANDWARWETDIKGFAKFWEDYPELKKKDDPNFQPPYRAHLYILADKFGDGVPSELTKLLEETGLPTTGYTVDTSTHEPEVEAGLQARSNVCLDPTSMTDLVHCQALSTNVVASDHGKYGEFTRMGFTLGNPEDQKTFGSLSLPAPTKFDVDSISSAMGKLYKEHTILRAAGTAQKGAYASVASAMGQKISNEVHATVDWLYETFSGEKASKSLMDVIAGVEKDLAAQSTTASDL